VAAIAALIPSSGARKLVAADLVQFVVSINGAKLVLIYG
jgi:hypothetical protein